jgi:hypothetical protein
MEKNHQKEEEKISEVTNPKDTIIGAPSLFIALNESRN